MAWETRRNGRRYYYAKRRVDGKVCSEYIGNGALAEEADLLAATKRIKREVDYLQRREVQKCEVALANLEIVVREAIEERLKLCGYHKHRGQWRKRRTAE